MTSRRVAFFTDSFHETNGVALTSREYVNFARRRSIPLLSVHAGPRNKISQDGSVTTFEFVRGPVRCKLEHDLAIDWLFWRHNARLRAALQDFRPDLVHITGPGDAGAMGALAAHRLRIPLAASWHTNLHEFAASRLTKLLRAFPSGVRSCAASWAERVALDLCVQFYRLSKVIFAPNPELVDMLALRTGRPAFLMSRGIDTNLFSPARRQCDDGAFVVGYVGRLSPEKNVRMLAELDGALHASGIAAFHFLIVGDGAERAWLRRALPRAELPGILRGEELARAYASMDAFVFPSLTDTFGNVVLEAMASGVPAIVSSAGGPRFLVESSRAGFVASTVGDFAAAVARLYRDPALRMTMAALARKAAERYSWDRVLEEVHARYDACFPELNAGRETGALFRAGARSASV